MTKLLTQAPGKVSEREALVWIDRECAVIVQQRDGGRDRVGLLNRLPDESEARFETRAISELLDQDRVVVSGPAQVRTGFERAYVAMTHRPDRLVDVEPTRLVSPIVRRTA